MRADHPRHGAAVGVDGEQRVQAILGGQHVADRRVRRQHADPADAPVTIAGGQHVVQVDGLVGPVERADPEVHDAHPHPVPVVPGDGDPRVEGGECAGGQR